MADSPAGDYILGTDPVELERLRSQHAVWAGELRDGCARAGIGPGHAVLDLGCGPGFTTMDLAAIVGPAGRVTACDRSERFLAFLGAEAARRGFANIRTVAGDAEDLVLPAESLDGCCARWLLCWLPRPEAALARAAAALKPGGRVLVHDYVEWGSMRLFPRDPAFSRGISGCLAHWREAGITVNVMERLPVVAAAAGLRVASLRPLQRFARTGSPEWAWVTTFLLGYLPKVVAEGILTEAEFAAFRAAVEARTASGDGWFATPAMAEGVLEKA